MVFLMGSRSETKKQPTMVTIVCAIEWLQLLMTLWMSSVHMSCPQHPCSTAVESCLLLLQWSWFILCWALRVKNLLSSIFSAFLWCVQNRKASLLLFLPPEMFQVKLALELTCSSFGWSRVSIEFPFNTTFQMSPFLPYQPSLLFNFCICTH